MYLDRQTTSILINKLQFSSDDIFALERDIDSSAQIIGYVQIICSDYVEKDSKYTAVKKIRMLQKNLYNRHSQYKDQVDQAFEKFYSFSTF